MSISARPAGGNLSGNKIPKGYAQGQLQQFTPEQVNLFQSLFGHVGPDSYLSKLAGGSEEAFAPMEQKAQRDFQEYSGQLGSRFSQLAPGAMSAQRGSGFQNQANQASSDFALELANRRHALQSGALQQLFEMSNSLLNQRPTEQFLAPKKKPFWQELLGGLAPGIGQGLGTAGSLWGLNKTGLLG